MKSVLHIAFALSAIALLASCNKVTELLQVSSPREKYLREFRHDTLVQQAWDHAYTRGLLDSLRIQFPYRETGTLNGNTYPAYSYNMILRQGEVFHLEVASDTTNPRLFIELHEMIVDSIRRFNRIDKHTGPVNRMKYVVENTGEYKVLIQPEIAAYSPFVLDAYLMPTYLFPVAGVGNGAIQSFWGAPRGGRMHEGIDIFARRGTPVVAATDGIVSFTGEKGLGGKQVWLRAGMFGPSLYYAHLDSIAVASAARVSAGDTLGFVGNTGNAHGTTPHLHFGIYGRNGAVDPLAYVFQRTRPAPVEEINTAVPKQEVVLKSKTNLRVVASAKGEKIGESEKGDTLLVFGETGEWLHVMTADSIRAFLHESTVK